MQENRATFSLEINGTDYAKVLIPRLSELTLTDSLEGEADELSFTLSNHDGALAPIKRGSWVTLSLGWLCGPDVAQGLLAKGRFKIDQVSKKGPPDQITVRARSADVTGSFRQRRDRGWKNTTLGKVITEVAYNAGYVAKVHPDLTNIPVASLEQASKSDMAFIRDLGRKHDAVATVKDRKLLFSPIGASTNASGQTLPILKLDRRQVQSWTSDEADREQHDGAEAQWHDRDEAKRKTVRQGKANNPKRLKHTYASEAEAKEAARAEASRSSRGKLTFTCELALGDPICAAGLKVSLTGWDSEIDSAKWLITSVTHMLNGSGGFTTSLEMASTG